MYVDVYWCIYYGMFNDGISSIYIYIYTYIYILVPSMCCVMRYHYYRPWGREECSHTAEFPNACVVFCSPCSWWRPVLWLVVCISYHIRYYTCIYIYIEYHMDSNTYWIPSGKLTFCCWKSPCYSWENPRTKWPFSIAMYHRIGWWENWHRQARSIWW